MLFLSESDIKAALDMKGTIDALETAFRVHSEGKTKTPVRTHLDLDTVNGIGLFMPSWVEPIKAMGIKTVTVYQDNPGRNLPVIQGTVQLFDGETGTPVSVMEASYITKLRTGASSGVATRYLAPQGATRAAIIGTGAQAYTQLWAVLTAVPGIEEYKIFDVARDKAQAFKAQVEKDFSEVSFVVAGSAAEAVKEAQIITTCTTAREPVFLYSDLGEKEVHINAVGAFTPQMQEIDAAIMKKADKLFVDDFEGALAESGDLIIPMRDGKLVKEDINGEIGEVLLEKKEGREAGDGLTVYETVGMGSLDVVAARAIYESALKNKVGTELSLK